VKLASVYAPLIKTLEGVGYKTGQNIFGAPYDWRLPSSFAGPAFLTSKIQGLVQAAYAMNGNKSVSLIGHSMGCTTVQYFLSQMTPAWKAQYINSFIPLAGPYAGAAKALRAVLSGDNFGLEVLGLNILNPAWIRDAVIQSGGVISLVPASSFWPSNQVFVYTPTKNYTASDFDSLFQIANQSSEVVYGTTKNSLYSLPPPNVATYCIYGVNVETEVAYVYPDGNIDDQPQVITQNDGDGTVPIDSLRVCKNWSSQQSASVSIKEISLAKHVDILKNDDVLDYVLRIITH